MCLWKQQRRQKYKRKKGVRGRKQNLKYKQIEFRSSSTSLKSDSLIYVQSNVGIFVFNRLMEWKLQNEPWVLK